MTTFVSLNSESGGRPGFREYLCNLKAQVSYFGFQEVHHRIDQSLPNEVLPPNPGKREYPLRTNLRNEIEQLLGVTWQSSYVAHVRGYHDYEPSTRIEYGQQSTISLKEFTILAVRKSFIYRAFNNFNTERSGGLPCGKAAIGHLLRHIKSGRHLVVINVHGFRSSFGKRDTSERLVLNAGINELATSLLQYGGHLRPGLIILGDLNYRNRMIAAHDLAHQPCFGQKGGINLNLEFEITRTRTENYRNWREEPQADYIFVSRDLARYVTACTVDKNTPSDHMALMATCKF